ncbi:UDP-N-acetylglucosamine 1-carboxyvinyltransferase [Clostridium sp. MD294]|uniref:UDP-N-acetylglucosamine 1-carboxyvinyltransferase n=1 Tax=Clostridium sp. MD294 TaxID=97138 RepID=UPI0002CCB115|nr:UDP-N-acetylglucosamine 1-carboxyvinyltransferase [Clostridium sp. MD294]NDO46343.1 UDP-N-acetylglucosamine 1-carboxyvinyltransferase [Clostridium sp. MD294]USF29230.1 UDP-N-acetylglucosamine 1-carboxyvinyltransferase 1 [Clostridium sp. MD294]
MSKFVIEKKGKLEGSVAVGGCKNAILPILAATLLTEEKCVINAVPPLSDVMALCSMIKEMGIFLDIDQKKQCVSVCAKNIESIQTDYQKAAKMRASFLIMGALLARCQEAIIPLPGGCPIGSRPVDLHLKGFYALGANSEQSHGLIHICAKKLQGDKIYLDFPSVGATENIMIAATLAKGITTIVNAAAEPEVIDLAEFLKKMGADITGEGTNTITITGVKKLSGAEYTVMPDRIEAGTFMIAAAITKGDIVVENVREKDLKPILAKLSETNVKTQKVEENAFRVYTNTKLQPVSLKTMPFPGFPTDMQAPFMSLLSVIKGTSMITETVFENRFLHASELQRMGAKISIDSRTAVIEGVDKLTGTQVKAMDLRGGAGLILSALAAEGKTEISDIYHIERGYYNIEKKLQKIGANIVKVT